MAWQKRAALALSGWLVFGPEAGCSGDAFQPARGGADGGAGGSSAASGAGGAVDSGRAGEKTGGSASTAGSSGFSAANRRTCRDKVVSG